MKEILAIAPAAAAVAVAGTVAYRFAEPRLQRGLDAAIADSISSASQEGRNVWIVSPDEWDLSADRSFDTYRPDSPPDGFNGPITTDYKRAKRTAFRASGAAALVAGATGAGLLLAHAPAAAYRTAFGTAVGVVGGWAVARVLSTNRAAQAVDTSYRMDGQWADQAPPPEKFYNVPR